LAGIPIDPATIAKINALAEEHPDWGSRKIAKQLGLHHTTILTYRANPTRAPSSQPVETSEVKGDTWAISLPRTRIHTLEQLVKFCEIDLGLWEVERFICNKWEVGIVSPAYTEVFTVTKPNSTQTQKGSVTNDIPLWQRSESKTDPIIIPLYQVKAFLKKRKEVEGARAELERIKQEAAKYSPKKFPKLPHRKPISGIIVEYSILDHHHGALIWGKETGGADYDSAISRKCWEDALGALVARSRGLNADEALLVLGSDQHNSDNRAGTTEKGTPQDNDSRYQKVFSVSFETSRWGIDILRGEVGKVRVVMVPGNHDPLSTWHLGHSLECWYRNCKEVTVDNGPTFRKYFEHGVNMLMFTHGSGGKLEDYGKTMAAEQPAMWGRTRWREAHTGDKHHRRLIELKGATVRILPSLRPPDAWSSENHYVGSIRAAEAYAWSREEGLIGTAVHSILEKP